MLRLLGATAISVVFFFNSKVLAKSDTRWIPDIKIASHDGTLLKAQLWEPSLSKFPGKRPTVIFLNSWGLNKNQYDGPARELVKKGYVAMSYSTRGFGGSEGEVQAASENDTKDLSSMIDWLLENTRADVNKMAALGISYGAGIALITSAKDDRLSAIVAMSSWTDLEYSLYPNETLNKVWIEFLIRFGQVSGKLSERLMNIYRNAKRRVKVDDLKQWARVRSAKTYIDDINSNQPAIYLSHNYRDQLFPINQIIRFFDKLTTPKKLVTHKGIHFSAEAKGLLGLRSKVWRPVYEWLDHWLLEEDNGVEPDVIVYNSIKDKQAYLSSGDIDRDDDLVAVEIELINNGKRSDSRDTIVINSSKDSKAETGIPILSALFESYLGLPVKHDFNSTRKGHGAIYQSKIFDSGAKIKGIPKIEVYFESYFADTQIVAYLYDIPPRGKAELITHGVASYHGMNGEIMRGVFDLQASSYDIEPGHRIGIIIDTGDALYQSPSDETFSYSIKNTENMRTRILLPLK